MTAQTPTTLLKSQLNITHALDDDLLAHKLAVAELWIGKNTGTSFDPSDPILTEAALMLGAFWYEQREAASFGLTTAPVPFGVRELLNSYRESVTGHVIN